MSQLIRISFVTVVCLALYGAHSLCNTYQIIKREATYQEALDAPVPLPNFAMLSNNIDYLEERERFWEKVDK